MEPLSSLILKHAGRPAFVMGGGVSLTEHLTRAPSDAVYLSANQHGCFAHASDYIVSCDDFSRRTFLNPEGRTITLKSLGVPVVSPRRADADIFIAKKQPVNLSGAAAAWVAWALGCAPILLAGMDCWQGGTYYYKLDADSTGTHLSVPQHLARWETLRVAIPAAMIRSMGGPTEQIFPRFDPAEPLAPLPSREEIEAQVKGHTVRVVIDQWSLAPAIFKRGEVVEVNDGESEMARKKHLAEVVA